VALIYYHFKFRNNIKLSVKDFFKFFLLVLSIWIFKLCFFRIFGKTWENEIFKKTKVIKSLSQVMKLLLNSFCSKKFKDFTINNEINKFYFLKVLKPYFRFLYKFKSYRELSFVCQEILKKINNISIFELSFLKKKNNCLLFSWDYSLRKIFLVEAFNTTKKHRTKLSVYIHLNILNKKNKKTTNFVCNYINNTIFFFFGEFSYGPPNRLGEDTFINFVLFYRKFYLVRYQCIKNLVWVHIQSKKKLLVNYFFDFLNFFKFKSITGFYSLIKLNFTNSIYLKEILNKYYKKGLFNKFSKIHFDSWFYDFIDTCLINNLIPFKINNSFKSFLFSFLYMSFCYISQTYNFFKFLYLSFSILLSRFNFKGLPSLDGLRVMIKWLAYKYSGILSSTDSIWLVKETNFLLKKKYKDLKVWKIWKSYKNLSWNKKKYILLKAFTKSNESFFDYYLIFFGGVRNMVTKFKSKKLGTLNFFQSVESRLDIVLYRLGFLKDLFYLRKCINLGWFLVDNIQIKFISYFLLLNIIIMPTLKASIGLLRQFKLFKLSLSRLKINKGINFWFKSKINHLRYLEVNYNKLAFIIIRRPFFGEITYISSKVKFTKKRFPLFEYIKSKHYIFSRYQYSKFINSF
jgi:ribosomal protein S4